MSTTPISNDSSIQSLNDSFKNLKLSELTALQNELAALQKKISDYSQEKLKEVVSTYGEWFCNIVGTETIANLPVVEAKQLHLEGTAKYPQSIVTPDYMKGLSAVRSIDGSNRPLIAITIQVRNNTTKEIEYVMTEIVMKRYPLTGDGRVGGLHENNYVTALMNVTLGGDNKTSLLYSSGGMSTEQVEAVRDLLNGREIKAPLNDLYWIKKV